MRYTIHLDQMEFRAFHGCYDLEQKVGNRFLVNVDITTSLEDIERDDVSRAVNYLVCYEIIAAQMRITQRTIEAVALNIIKALKAEFSAIESVRCTVAKLAPPLGGKLKSVSVELEG